MSTPVCVVQAFRYYARHARCAEEVRAYFCELAKKGKYPQKGGKARARKLTAEQRSAIAKRAAEARWKSKPEKSESSTSTKAAKPKTAGK